MKFTITLFFCLSLGLSAFAAQTQVKIITNFGDMTLQLEDKKSKETVNNFLGYVKDGFYSGTVFHRIIDGFMIQGGGMTINNKGKFEKKQTKKPIKNEARVSQLLNKRGTIAMARTSNPHSATSQFFINHTDNTNLDPSGSNHGYAVFGKLIDGDKVLDKIATTDTKPDDSPIKNVIIKKIEVIKK